jgi:hypothetical protein
MSEENRNILSVYLDVDSLDIIEDAKNVFYYQESKYAVGTESEIFNLFIKMIHKNAHRYVRKVSSTHRLIELGLLDISNIDSDFTFLKKFMSSEEILENYMNGTKDVSKLLSKKILSIDFVTNKELAQENFKRLKEDSDFINDFDAKLIFEEFITEEDFSEVSLSSMKKATTFIKSKLDDFNINVLESIIRIFIEESPTSNTQKLAESISKHGGDDADLVIQLMGSPEEFAQGFCEKVKGSYAACLDNRSQVNTVGSYFICDVTNRL